MKKVTTYLASDGKEFEDEAEAKQWDEVVTAKANFESAREAYAQALLKREKTIDGYPFHLPSYRTYYRVNTLFGLPRLSEVRFNHDWEVELPNYNGGIPDGIILLSSRGGEEGGYTHSRVSDLYHDRENAEKALLAEQEKFLRRKAKELGIDLSNATERERDG